MKTTAIVAFVMGISLMSHLQCADAQALRSIGQEVQAKYQAALRPLVITDPEDQEFLQEWNETCKQIVYEGPGRPFLRDAPIKRPRPRQKARRAVDREDAKKEAATDNQLIHLHTDLQAVAKMQETYRRGPVAEAQAAVTQKTEAPANRVETVRQLLHPLREHGKTCSFDTEWDY